MYTCVCVRVCVCIYIYKKTTPKQKEIRKRRRSDRHLAAPPVAKLSSRNAGPVDSPYVSAGVSPAVGFPPLVSFPSPWPTAGGTRGGPGAGGRAARGLSLPIH